MFLQNSRASIIYEQKYLKILKKSISYKIIDIEFKWIDASVSGQYILVCIHPETRSKLQLWNFYGCFQRI
ncbi:MAG: hypothetical protein DRQ49_13360 [Gammaproteobacteria bacterium]|nr:MAG: hypothetical protein DRQ49_13360 [Gammaproteobacteria bacterium]RKZ76042.1 MAG: hypothetical protein DRQ57_05335 [Gammaproteobacteria bacterium]